MVSLYKFALNALLSVLLVIALNNVVKASYSLAFSCPTAVTKPAASTGTQLVPFSKSFAASGGLAPHTFAISSVLPTGLTLTSAGLLHGTPTESGTFPITVTATDANSCTDKGTTYTLVISSGTFGVARWVNNTAGTRPARVIVNCNIYNTAAVTDASGVHNSNYLKNKIHSLNKLIIAVSL